VPLHVGATQSELAHTKLRIHIFEGDYYDITDDLPRNEQEDLRQLILLAAERVSNDEPI
jgi:hypothetical protein